MQLGSNAGLLHGRHGRAIRGMGAGGERADLERVSVALGPDVDGRPHRSQVTEQPEHGVPVDGMPLQREPRLPVAQREGDGCLIQSKVFSRLGPRVLGEVVRRVLLPLRIQALAADPGPNGGEQLDAEHGRHQHHGEREKHGCDEAYRQSRNPVRVVGAAVQSSLHPWAFGRCRDPTTHWSAYPCRFPDTERGFTARAQRLHCRTGDPRLYIIQNPPEVSASWT